MFVLSFPPSLAVLGCVASSTIVGGFFYAFCKPLSTSVPEHRYLRHFLLPLFFFLPLRIKAVAESVYGVLQLAKAKQQKKGKDTGEGSGASLLCWKEPVKMTTHLVGLDLYYHRSCICPEAGLLCNRLRIRSILSLTMKANIQEVLCC